jgi:hypothetical protein
MNAQWERANKLSGDDVLIAVCLERFGDHPLFAPPYGLCKQAIIRGLSTESSASFKFETCPLSPTHMERFERLREHGFTSMLAPANWRYKYPPHTWHDELIVEAVSKAEKFPQGEPPSRQAGYDHELATAVMEALNEAFPHSLALIELKYQFRTEPSDIVLSDVLNALRGDGFIDGPRGFQNTSKLNPLERIALSTDGRRHLSDEMKKRSKAQQSFTNSEATNFILKQLLTDFQRRSLGTSDLQQGYEGIQVRELKELAAANGIRSVDFDLAFDDLEEHHLVLTGPFDVAGGSMGGGILVAPMVFSKREYLCLRADGYKEAVQIASSATQPKSDTGVGKTIIHGSQYNVFGGHVAAIGSHSTGTISFQQQWTAIQNEIDLTTLTGELEQLRKHLQQSAASGSDYQQLSLLAEAEEHARKRDGSKTMEVLSKIGKGALDVAKDIGTEIAAKVIAKSMGLEP